MMKTSFLDTYSFFGYPLNLLLKPKNKELAKEIKELGMKRAIDGYYYTNWKFL